MLIHKSVTCSNSEMAISEPEHKSTVQSTEVQKMQEESLVAEQTAESKSLLKAKDIKAEIETHVEAEVPSSTHSAITDDDGIPRNITNDKPQEDHNPSEKEHDPQNASDAKTSVDQVNPRPSDTTLECEKCHKKFKMRRQKMDHLRLVHASKNHKCNHCDSSFVSKQRLNKHMIVHDTSTNINKDFSEPEDTYTEYDRMSRIIVFEKKECPLCNRMIKLPFLEGHLNRHKGVQPFECKMGCMEKFRCKIERNTHYRDVHGWKAHRCDFCQQYFHSHRSCILHKAKVHSSGFKCQECFTAFASRSGLHRHMLSTKHSNDNSGIQIAQVESKAEEPKSSFEAAVKTDDATALPISSFQPKEVHNPAKDEHNPQNASEPKPCVDQVDTKVIQYFQCKMGCVEKFRSKFRRNVHYCDVHEWKAHQCEICLQRFHSHRSYVMHKAKVHSSGYRCQNCPTVFASRSGLHRHRRNAEYTKGICGIDIAPEEPQVNKPTAESETLLKAKDIKVEIETDEDSELPLSSWLHKHNSGTQIAQIESQATEQTAEPESLFEAEDIKVEVETDEEAELRNSSHSAKDMSTDAKIFRNNSMIDKPKEIHNQVMGEHNPENSSKPKTCVDQGIDPTNECEKCGKQFKWRRQLMDHRRLVHAARDHKCTLCEKLFLSKKKLDAHMYVHKLLPSTEADMDISEPEETHEVHDSEKRGYVVTKKACLVCNRKIKLAFMEGHLYRHKGVKPFKCKMGCTEKFYCKFKRKSHYHVAHGWKSYKCDICQQYFPSHRSCILHKAKAHSFGFKCLECLAVFASSSGLYRHMRNTKHSNGDSGIQLMQMEDLATEQAAEAESLFEAEDIKLEIETDEEAEIPSSSQLSSHIDKSYDLSEDTTSQELMKIFDVKGISSSGLPVECNVCDKVFKSRKHLLDHRRQVHYPKPYKCTECDKAFVARSRLDRHMPSHPGFRSHKIVIQSEVSGSLKPTSDAVYDPKTKQYKTKLCSSCKRRIRLNLFDGHLNRHKGIQPYACEMGCAEQFHCKVRRKRHYHVDHGWKAYQCDVCYQYFPSIRSCMTHKRKFHVRGHVCQECHETFPTSSGFKKHIAKTKHKQNNENTQKVEVEPEDAGQLETPEGLSEADLILEDIKLEVLTEQEAELLRSNGEDLCLGNNS
nr:zinc finger protein 808-like isoform X1 [Aedes albopictus]